MKVHKVLAIIGFPMGLVIILFIAWLHGYIGWWKTLDTATSPDGSTVVLLKVWHKPGPLYAWEDYYLQLTPARQFYSTTPDQLWRGTPSEIVEPKERHFLCRYNTFDDENRFPKDLRWTSPNAFQVVGGEGKVSSFQIVRNN